MADEPISALTLFTSYSTADEVEILDVSDTTFASTGTNKRIQFSSLLTMAGVGTAAGVATVAGGGTGLTAVGSADQLLGVAHTGGALEYKTLTAGSNITITPAAGSITIASSPPGTVTPEAYGAVGDGVHDDTVAINLATLTGLSVWLTLGKTYLTWGGHFLAAGQVLYGNGATFKLHNQVAQACSGTATLGGNTVTVTSTAGLAVGAWISCCNAAQASAKMGTNWDGASHKILSIVGNTVTIGDTWGLTVAGGTLYTAPTVLSLGQNNSVVRDLRIDGNMANYSWNRWEVTWGIQMYGNYCKAEHCYLYNMPGEGIELRGNYTSAEACVVNTANGNGYHLTTTEHPVVHNCVAVTCNQDTTIGHAMGGIGWSDTIQDATVSDCYVSGCLNGLGMIDSPDNSDVTVTGCTFRSCVTSGIYINPSNSAFPALRLVITGNRIYACPVGITCCNTLGATAPFPGRISISNNSFDACTAYSIRLLYALFVNITGNRFEAPPGSATVKHIAMDNSQQIAVSGNTFNGGGIGVVVYGSATAPGTKTQNVSITGNTFMSQYTGAIQFYDSGILASHAVGNTIVMDTTAANSYFGMKIAWPTSVCNNSIYLNNNGGAITGVVGILLGYLAGGGGSNAMGNTIRGTSAYGIQTYGGSYGCVLMNNIYTATTPLSIGGGTCTTAATFGTPTISGGAITAVPVTNGGTGYSGTPYISCVGGGGSGLTLTPVMSSGVIASVTVTGGGTGFTSAPTIYASGNYSANNQVVA